MSKFKNLPHDKLGATPVHLTYRLAGSLPQSILGDLQRKRVRKIEALEVEKFIRAMWYVLNNPVEAGLIKQWKDWPNTWLNPEYNQLFLDDLD